MIGPIGSAHRAAWRSRLAGRVAAVALLATGAALEACGRDQPLAPGSQRAAPDGPSRSINPACDPGLGGVTHADSVLTPETWSRGGNPHRVDQFINIEGAGVLTLGPGVRVCFGIQGALLATNGGRIVADGLDTARIVLTATDPVDGWRGVHAGGTPASPSTLKHVLVEYTRDAFALSTHDSHPVYVDSTVFRQNEAGVYLWGRGGRISRSRVDTVTYAPVPAVVLGSVVTFEQTAIRGAAGIGLAVLGTNGISLLGGRVEGSGGVGMQVTTTGPGFVATQPVRVVGGASYPAELVVSAFPRIYPTLAQQDSLLGNARDTLVVTGGILQAFAYPTQALPWHVTGNIVVQYFGILRAWPGAALAFDSAVSVTADNGGRVVARGTAAAPVLFTSATGAGWGGLILDGVPSLASYLTNVRIEHVTQGVSAVWGGAGHPVVIDSAVVRQNTRAAWLSAPSSRISRSRIDTTTAGPAVLLYASGITLESTRIRASSGTGLVVVSGVQVLSCEIRDSGGVGIDLASPTDVHNCNLVNNGGDGIFSIAAGTANVEDNWWGDAAGPTGPSGDGASGPLDYTPWRTTPYVLPYVP
jgi:hypothetical protein